EGGAVDVACVVGGHVPGGGDVGPDQGVGGTAAHEGLDVAEAASARTPDPGGCSRGEHHAYRAGVLRVVQRVRTGTAVDLARDEHGSVAERERVVIGAAVQGGRVDAAADVKGVVAITSEDGNLLHALGAHQVA